MQMFWRTRGEQLCRLLPLLFDTRDLVSDDVLYLLLVPWLETLHNHNGCLHVGRGWDELFDATTPLLLRVCRPVLRSETVVDDLSLHDLSNASVIHTSFTFVLHAYMYRAQCTS